VSTRNCAHVYSTIREDHATPELAGTGEYSVVLPFGMLYLGVSGSQATYQAISVCAACRQFPWKVRHPADRYLLSYEIQCLPLLASLPIPHARYRQPQYECTLREMGRWLSPGGTAAVSLRLKMPRGFPVQFPCPAEADFANGNSVCLASHMFCTSACSLHCACDGDQRPYVLESYLSMENVY
jgi:hypothetical protein